MDFSGYDKSHKLYSAKKCPVIGKFEDETDGNPIIDGWIDG
jgi:hypothetical protein